MTGTMTTRRVARSGAVAIALTAAMAIVGPPVSAQDGGQVTLTIGLTQNLSSPNVTAGYLVSDYELWNLQYAGLTDKDEALETVPGLAESWEADDDGLTYTYTLREGLAWSDGEPLTADDIAWTINTSRDDEWFNHYSVTANLDAEVIDDRTVRVTSSVPDPKLPALDVYIVPRHVWEPQAGDDISTYDALDGVGSGPFTLEQWRSGQDWTLVANPNFWGGRPEVDRIVFRVFTNAAAMVAALQSGEIDAAHGVPASSFQRLADDPDIEAVEGNQGTFAELAMNGGAGGIGDGHPALLDPIVRRAIHHAIDKSVLLDRVSLGLGEVGTTIRPTPDPVWRPDLGDRLVEFDPDRARALLDEAGYLDTDGDGVREMPDGGRPLTFRYAERSESDSASAIREFVTGWLDDIGIATTIDVYDDNQLYERQIAGEYDLFVWGWGNFADPDTMLSYFTCDQVTYDVEADGYNDANWCDEEYDALYERQKVELDRDARIEIVHDMLELFYERSTYVVLLEEPDLQAYRTDRFDGWVRQPVDTGPVMFTISSPSYERLTPVAATDDGGVGTVVIVVAVAVGLLVLGGGAWAVARSRAGRDDRE